MKKKTADTYHTRSRRRPLACELTSPQGSPSPTPVTTPRGCRDPARGARRGPPPSPQPLGSAAKEPDGAAVVPQGRWDWTRRDRRGRRHRGPARRRSMGVDLAELPLAIP
jgi:hypothetical protein